MWRSKDSRLLAPKMVYSWQSSWLLATVRLFQDIDNYPPIYGEHWASSVITQHNIRETRTVLCQTSPSSLEGGWPRQCSISRNWWMKFSRTRDVLTHLKIVRGLVIVTFSAPLSEADSLNTLAREQSSFVVKVGVSLLVVADTVITQSESTDFSLSLLFSIR